MLRDFDSPQNYSRHELKIARLVDFYILESLCSELATEPENPIIYRMFCLRQQSWQFRSKHRMPCRVEILLDDALLRTMQPLYQVFSQKICLVMYTVALCNSSNKRKCEVVEVVNMNILLFYIKNNLPFNVNKWRICLKHFTEILHTPVLWKISI